MMNGCPYIAMGKMSICVSPEECYYYFGSVEDGLREGRGRTAMMDGGTAFEGGYLHDQRDGFGTYYYKSGSFAMPAIGRKTAGTVWASRLRPATAPATLAFGIRTAR